MPNATPTPPPEPAASVPTAAAVPPAGSAPASAAWITWILPAAVALVASAILLVDYVRPTPIFCGDGGGCETLKLSDYARPLGVPLPVIGLVGQLVALGLGVLRGARARAAHFVVALAGGTAGASLLALQIALRTFCVFCMFTDVSAVLLAVAVGVRFWRALDPPSTWRWRVPSIAVPLVAAAVPFVIALLRPAPPPPAVPDVVAREIAATPPGKITVVDFVDFECAFCRMTNDAIRPVLDANAAKIRLVRKQAPLTRIHPHAMDAARAACCGEELGAGDAFADALFSAPEDELTPEGGARIAARLGLDAAKYAACVKDARTDARIARETAEFRACHTHGLPTIWVQTSLLEGAQTTGSFDLALRKALRGS